MQSIALPPPAPIVALSDNKEEVTSKGKKKKRDKLSSSDIPAVALESVEGEGTGTVDPVDSVLPVDGVSGSMSLSGGKGEVSVLHGAAGDNVAQNERDRGTDWSNTADLSLSVVEWRLDSEVLQWCKSAPSSGPSTPTRSQIRERKSPLSDPFSIGMSSSGNEIDHILPYSTQHVIEFICQIMLCEIILYPCDLMPYRNLHSSHYTS